jgi:cbb3-type cytochrome oxidase subunit 3
MRLTDVMSHAGLAIYAEVAMVLFLIAFGIIVVRTFWPSRRDEMDRASRLPLEEDDPAERSATGAKP